MMTQQKTLIAKTDAAIRITTSPHKPKAVRITGRRTIVEEANASKHDVYGGDERTQSIVRHSEMTIEWTLSSDTVLATDDPDNFDLIAYADPKPHTNGSHPLTGSGQSCWRFTSEEKNTQADCSHLNKKNGQFSASGNLKDVELSFSYNPTKDEGEFQLTAPFNNATGEATEHVESSGCNDPSGDVDKSKVAAAEMNMQLTAFGAFAARNKPIDMSFLGQAAVEGAQKIQETLDNTGMGGYCTITHNIKCGGDYEITYTTNKIINTLGEGWNGASTRTINTEVHILISGNQKQYDAIIEPLVVGGASGNYEKWIPEGPTVDSTDKPVTSKGNSISFKVFVVDKANPEKAAPDVKYDVEYSLTKGSKEPGYCNNFPLTNADQKWDLRFDSSMNYLIGIGLFSDTLVKSHDLQGKTVMPIITSYDYGGFAKLKVKVILECGQELEAHLRKDSRTEIAIPMDNNNNQIADEWEKENGVTGLNDAWDEEESPENNHNGDGLTLYEEYRGVVAKGRFIRLDPHKKELFVLNHIGQEAQPGFNLFQNASGIKVIELSDKDIDKYDLVVNVNSVFAKLGKQHALLLEYRQLGTNNQGFTLNRAGNKKVPTSPGDCQFVSIDSSYPFKGNDKAVAIAHEMAHGCGVSHHGNMPPLNAPSKNAIDNSYQFYGNNMLPVSIELIKNQGLLGDIAGPGSQSSGDMYCIMCYSGVFVWAAPKGTEGKIYINVDGHADDCPKIKFCDSNNGTFLNDSNHKPYPVYGDATNGGCIHLFQVKDWH